MLLPFPLQFPKLQAENQVALTRCQVGLAKLKQQEAEQRQGMELITSEAAEFAGTVAGMRQQERGLKGRLATARKEVQKYTGELEEAQVGGGCGLSGPGSQGKRCTSQCCMGVLQCTDAATA